MLSTTEIKFIRSLQLKKNRKEANCFVIEGRKGIEELINSNITIRMLVLSDTLNQKSFKYPKVDCKYVSQATIKKLSGLKSNDFGIALAEIPDEKAVDYAGVVILLDHISDPGNLGTIIRTADWYGIDQVVCSPSCVDFYNPKVVQATMGSFCRVIPVYQDLKVFLEEYPNPVYGTLLEGNSIHKTIFSQDMALIVGSESHGISPELSSFVTEAVTIPGKGRAESLNVSVATAICLDRIMNGRI